nr:hypothetical protein [Tanacetum cinerariifolium]
MALGAAISRSIEKGMQDEADFNYALQELRELDYPLIAELKSHKDASVEDIMNLLRLEGRLADAPAMGDLQPDIEQLKVPIHRSEDQNLIGESSTSASVGATTVTTTTLSTSFASTSFIPPITVDDYEIIMRMVRKVLRGMFKGMLPQLNLRRRIWTLLRSMTCLAELILFDASLFSFIVFVYLGRMWPFCSGVCTFILFVH